VQLPPELSPATRAWFEASFAAPTPVQAEGWARIAAGEHALLLAPTGSGKTLAAFLWCIDRLACGAAAGPPDHQAAPHRRAGSGPEPPGVRVLYVSPLKALVHDIERNLRAPLVGVQRAAERLGAAVRMPRVAVRTGDTPAALRAAQSRDPAEILVTTPESLYLILGSAQRETLRTVETVIVDEIHALAPTKRGAHLALSLERVAALAPREPQRIGLSATARPVAEVARFLGGDRPVAVVDRSEPPRLDLEIRVPVPDMTQPVAPAPAPPPDRKDRAPDLRTRSLLAELAARDAAPDAALGMWPAIEPRLVEEIRAHRSTIVFVNSRGLCERLCARLNELAEEELVRAHHGSLSHATRKEIEEALKAGRIRGIVATSSLELGIDMGAVDLVLMVESPGTVARGLQRVGRAGHGVGETSRGRLYPKHRGDLLEATVVCRGMQAGAVESLRVPRNPLDVLAQQIVAMCAMEPWSVEALERLVRRAAPYRDLSHDALVAVLDMLAGRYPSTDFAELRPRLVWDREADRLEARRGAGKLALLSGGTIPDRGLYAVHVAPDGPRVGELDEEMVHETRPGQTITLGASTWRVLEITRDRVLVAPAPGEVGRLPFWRGEGPGRPLELGRALGAFLRELGARTPEDAEAWLRAEWGLDAFAARNLRDHVAEQRAATGTLPTDRALTVERFRDELGDWRVCILSPWGARLHAPWALARGARLSQEAGFEVQALWSDDGIALRLADAERPPDLSLLLPEPEEVEELLLAQLGHSALFAAAFRENAARALLLPRRRPGARTPLWVQRLRAQNLLAVARQFPSFPIVLETYRTCLQDVFDLPGLVDLLRRVRAREVRVDEVETPSASPFARGLVFAYTAAYLYQGDSPAAERRAQALTLDRNMLRDLLGEDRLRELLDARALADVEAEIQGLAEGHRAAHPDGLHDLLRRVGDLDDAELAARCEGDAAAWLAELARARRAAPVRIAGVPRWIAVEDAALYRDALGCVPPPGLADALLEPVEGAVDQLLTRYARTHGPFAADTVARRFGLVPAQAEALLGVLEARGRLLGGEFRPEGRAREWCDAEMLRRIRRRTLARLRGEVAPVEARTLARFLPAWHGIGAGHTGERRLDEALAQLEGVPLPFSDLERAILPARVRDFDPRQLDERGALGRLVWVGAGALGERDGRIALYRRERAALLLAPAAPPDDLSPVARALLDHLGRRGASFFAELVGAAGAAGALDPEREALGALWDLVWAGLVTNDTFAPLRALAARGRQPAPAARGRRPGRHAPGAALAAAGRWSLVALLADPPAEPTRRAHARALGLLDRWGIVARDAMDVEAIPGGFSAVYPVLRAMEETGKLRRGHFVEGLAGAQFAFAGAVDQLRAVRAPAARVVSTPQGDAGAGLGGASGAPRAAAPDGIVLAACDPANPFGALLPWPPARSAEARPRRAAGAAVVLVDGVAALFLDRGGRQVTSFAPAHDEPGALDAAAAALHALLLDRRRRALRIERIDGAPALESPLRDAFLRAGFRADYKGLALDRSAPPPDQRV
jgi:ATP-dependent Lhr-like helicase